MAIVQIDSNSNLEGNIDRNEHSESSVRTLFDELDFDSDGIVRISESLSYLRKITLGSVLKGKEPKVIETSKAVRVKRTDRSSAGLKEWMMLRQGIFRSAQAKLMKPWPPAAAWDAQHPPADEISRPDKEVAPEIQAIMRDSRSGDALDLRHASALLEDQSASEIHDQEKPTLCSGKETRDFDLESTIEGPCEFDDPERMIADISLASNEDVVKCEESLDGAAYALSRGKYDTAGRICTAMIDAGTATFSAFYIRAESYRLLRQQAAAVEDYGYCLAIDAASARAHKGRGLCLLDMGRFAQAAMHLRRARALLPAADSAVCVSLGRCYEELGDITGALQEYDEAIGSDASSAYAFFCRGCCFRCIGEEERAGEDLAQVLQLDPLFVSRYMRMAVDAERRLDYQGAAKLYASLECLPFLSQVQMTDLKAQKIRVDRIATHEARKTPNSTGSRGAL